MSKKTNKSDVSEVEYLTIESETTASEIEPVTAELEIEPVETDSTDGLIAMRKAGEHLHVHPTTVTAHKDAGWEVA